MLRNVLPTELARGQTVIVYARWMLVLVGLLVAVWNPDSLSQLRIQVGVVLLVAVANFVMHAQILRRRPTIAGVAYAASLGDLLVISLLVASQGGFSSNTFVFYFPAVLAISVAFRTVQAAGLSIVGVCLAVVVGTFGARNLDEVVMRGLAVGAVAVIGNAYWRLHRARILPTASRSREQAQDLFWGQVATLWARWAVIVGGALLVLSRAASTSELAVGVMPVVILLVVNFYLHGRYLMERPANALLALSSSVLDLGVIAGLFLTWTGPSGLDNPAFVLLYPLVFAVGLVFPPRLSWAYTAASLVVYILLVAATSGIAGQGDLKMLAVRLVTLGAMGGLGSLYWRIVRRDSRPRSNDEATPTPSLAWQSAGAS